MNNGNDADYKKTYLLPPKVLPFGSITKKQELRSVKVSKLTI